MLNRRGTSTKTAYMSSAGRTNSQPTKASRRARLLIWVRRETGRAAGRLSTVIISRRSGRRRHHTLRPSPLLLREFPLVFCLNGLEESGSVLLAADHLLELRRPALGEDGARRVGDEVHRAAVRTHHRSGSERLVRNRASSKGRHRCIRWPAGVRPKSGDVDLAGRIIRGDPVEEERRAIRVLRLGRYAKGQWGGHGR